MDNKLAQLKEEISAMNNLKIRVDSEARSCSEPINIAQQCVTFRAGRQGCDLIRDDVDINLDRELDQLKMSQVWRIYSCYFGIDRCFTCFRVSWDKQVTRLGNKSGF